MTTDPALPFESVLTPDGHRALLSIASTTGQSPAAICAQMFGLIEPYLLDAAHIARGLDPIKSDLQASLARQLEVIDLFGVHADARLFVESVADALVKVERLRLSSRSLSVNALCHLPQDG